MSVRDNLHVCVSTFDCNGNPIAAEISYRWREAGEFKMIEGATVGDRSRPSILIFPGSFGDGVEIEARIGDLRPEEPKRYIRADANPYCEFVFHLPRQPAAGDRKKRVYDSRCRCPDRSPRGSSGTTA